MTSSDPAHPTDSKRPLAFTYWSDPLCIWAFVGQRRLDAVVASHGTQVQVRHRIVPVFGSIPQRFAAGSWAEGGPEGRAKATARIACQHGHDDVTGEIWVTDPPSSSWAAGAAAAALLLLEEEEQLGSGSAGRFLVELRRMLFVENLNVAHRSHQLACAERCHVPRRPIEDRLDDGRALARLWEEHSAKVAMGVRGSPTYEFDGGRELLYGNVNEVVLQATVEALRTGEAPGRSNCD